MVHDKGWCSSHRRYPSNRRLNLDFAHPEEEGKIPLVGNIDSALNAFHKSRGGA
jgi:hypothetical protein